MTDGPDSPALTAQRRPEKSGAAFRTISEVSDELDVPQHVLRFWESKFTQIKPLKRGGGRRYYRPEDVVLLRQIKDLLYRDGYTIRGVQKLLKEKRTGDVLSAAVDSAGADEAVLIPAASVAAESGAPLIAGLPGGIAEERGSSVGALLGRDDMLVLIRELEDLRDLMQVARTGGMT